MNQTAMLVGLVAGLALGLIASLTGNDFLMAVSVGVQPLGTVFINAIRMVVIPLVVAMIFTGVCRMGDPRKLGKLGGSAIAFFWGTTIPAIVMGMLLMLGGLRFLPAVDVPAPTEDFAREIPGFVDFLIRLVPANPIEAAANGALLPLIVFTVLFSAAAATLPEEKKASLLALSESITDTLVKLVHWVLWTAPIGIFGLSAPATATAGPALLQSMGVFILVVALGTYLFMATVYLPVVRFVGGMKPLDFIRGSIASYTMGFSSTSSVASLPVMIEDAERMKVSETVSGLVLSLGASINRAGSALFQGAAVVFLAHLYDVPISAVVLTSALVAVFFVAMSVAPVPSASVVTLAPALDAAGVPLAGMALILGIDRIPDMFRSATNITGHVAASVVVQSVVGDDIPDVAQTGPPEGTRDS